LISVRNLAVVGVFCLAPLVTSANDNITREELIAWIASGDSHAIPPADSVLGVGDAAIPAFLPPGYADEYDFPNVRLEIRAPTSFAPHQTYADATAAHSGLTTLAPDGGMLSYVAGQPFDPSQFDQVSTEKAGFMIAWNHIHRWQYYGWLSKNLTMYSLSSASGRAS